VHVHVAQCVCVCTQVCVYIYAYVHACGGACMHMCLSESVPFLFLHRLRPGNPVGAQVILA